MDLSPAAKSRLRDGKEEMLRKVMLPMLAGFVVASLTMMACSGDSIQILQFLTGPSDPGGVQDVTDALVRECRLAPQFVKMRNGGEERVKVTMHTGGGIEVLSSWPPNASIEGEPVVQILPDTPSSRLDREIILKGVGVGEASLVVRVGNAVCSAPITVTAASP